MTSDSQGGDPTFNASRSLASWERILPSLFAGYKIVFCEIKIFLRTNFISHKQVFNYFHSNRNVFAQKSIVKLERVQLTFLQLWKTFISTLYAITLRQNWRIDWLRERITPIKRIFVLRKIISMKKERERERSQRAFPEEIYSSSIIAAINF